MNTWDTSYQELDSELLLRFFREAVSAGRELTLHLSDGLGERIIGVRGKTVRLASRGERALLELPQYLVRQHLLDVESLEQALAESRGGNASFRTVLLKKSLLSREQYVEVMRRLTLHNLQDLAFWRDTLAVVYPDRAPRPIEEILTTVPEAPMDPEVFVDELQTWYEQWGRFKTRVISDRAMFSIRQSELEAIDSHEGPFEETLELCREPIQLRDLWADSRLEWGPLCEQLGELLNMGWLQVAPPEPPGEVSEFIVQLENNLQRFLGPDLVRDRLARAYAQSHRLQDAAAEWFTLARQEIQRGLDDQAQERCLRILEWDPTHLDALEVVVRAYTSCGQDQRGVAVAASHARLLLEMGNTEDAKKVVRKLHALNGSEDEVRALERELRGEGTSALGGASSRRLPARPVTASIAVSDSARMRREALSMSTRKASSLAAHIEQDLGEPEPHDTRPSSPVAAPPGQSNLLTRAAIVVLASACLVLAYLQFSARENRAEAEPQRVSESVEAVKRVEAPVVEPAAAPAPTERLVDGRPLWRENDRAIDQDRVARFEEDGSLSVRDRWTDRRLFQLAGHVGVHWSISHLGKVFASWEPGRPLHVYDAEGRSLKLLEWPIPVDTVAVLVDKRFVVLRRGSHSIFHSWEGKPLGGGTLPLWTEGVAVDDRLLLQKLGASRDSFDELWSVRIDPLEVLWSCQFERGPAMFR